MARRSRGNRSDPQLRGVRATLALGLDVGATKIVGGLVDRRGRLSARTTRREHGLRRPQDLVEEIVSVARESLAASPVPPQVVGVAIAAQVDRAARRALYAPNLGWRGVPLAVRMERALGLRVLLVNDARATTLGEWRAGAGRGARNLFCLCLGTGVGGSAVVDGRLLSGETNAAGEVGHITVESAGRRCHCPNSGCLEAYVGGWGIAERGAELGLAPDDRCEDRALTASDVLRAARRGDPRARALMRATERYLGDGVVTIAQAFNPALFVLVGGVARGWPKCRSVAREAIRRRCEPPLSGAKVVHGALGPYAGVVGAGLFALEFPATAPRRGRSIVR